MVTKIIRRGISVTVSIGENKLQMKHLTFLFLVLLFISSACAPARKPVVTPSIQVSQSTAIATSSPTLADPTITPRPTNTISLSPTHPPVGIFPVEFYPPLVLDYGPGQWVDKSEYGNTKMMNNFLQHSVLESCTIGPMGPSGFWPEDMTDKKLGSITYQVQYDQVTSTGESVSYYFAISAPGAGIDNDTGIAHFAVISNPSQADGCKAAAEDVLATLRRADHPAQ